MKYLVCLLTLLFFPLNAHASDPIGSVIAIDGTATVQHAENSKTSDLSENSAIHTGDVINTGKDSKLLLLLNDNSEFTLGENTNLTIDEYVYEPKDASKNKGHFTVLKGPFLLASGLLTKTENPNVEILTDVGSIGIRGTVVWGGPIDNEYGVLLQLGEVDVTNEHGKVTLYPGQGAFVPSINDSPRKIGTWADELTDRAVRMVTLNNSKENRTKLKAQKQKNLSR